MKKTEIPLDRIAEHVDGEVVGDGGKIIRGVAPFDLAADDQITFADSPKFYKRIKDVGAGAVIVPRDAREEAANLLVVNNPKVAFAAVLSLFHPPSRPETGISPQAVIGRGFQHGRDVSVAPMVSIGNDVTIGDRTVLHPGVVIGDNVVIGDDALIYPNVSILAGSRLGSRVIIHAGSVIGSDGYGYAPDGERYHKIPQVGFVQIDDDVEIGANNTIDRATMGKTWIQQGVKTDNLVHIAHNITVGENTVIVGQAGIAGSTSIGNHVIIAAKAAIADHIAIGDGAIVGPLAGVTKSVPAGHVVSGYPEMPHRTWLKVTRILPKLPELKKKLSALEKELKRLQAKD